MYTKDLSKDGALQMVDFPQRRMPVMILIDPFPLERISSFKYTGLSIFIYSNILTLLSKVWKQKIQFFYETNKKRCR